jgi:hypothetical protein
LNKQTVYEDKPLESDAEERARLCRLVSAVDDVVETRELGLKSLVKDPVGNIILLGKALK